MTRLQWDLAGQRRFETGVDHAVLYKPNAQGVYNNGWAWNGIVSCTESPSGAEASAQYADNIKYLNMVSAEEFGATLEAFTYPDEFAECDGYAVPVSGITLGQQPRKSFGLSYRTKIGNDLDQNAGYKLHLIYGALAAPSEKGYTTVNDSPEAITFSWELSTTPVNVPGYSATASVTVDSTEVDATALAALETILYGTDGVDPRLPSPEEVVALFEGTVTVATPTEPTYDSGTKTITIPVVTGVVYKISGNEVSGSIVIDKDTIVTAEPAAGYVFPDVVDDDWFFDF